MSSVRLKSRESTERSVPRGLRVTNWPLRDAPLASVGTLLICLTLAALCGWLSGSAAMGLLTAAALLLVFWKLWLPVTTELEPRGIVLSVLRFRRRIAWRNIDHLELDDAGVYLCAQPGPVKQAVLQSLFLPWHADWESIAAFCDDYRLMGMVPSSAGRSESPGRSDLPGS